MRALALTSLATAVTLGLPAALEPSSAQPRAGTRSVWNGDIYVINADGGRTTRLTRDPAAEYDPAWSRDGTKIAFSRFIESRSEIFLMNPDGSGAVQLTRGEGRASDAAWSPDGSRIAFTRCQGSCHVYAVDADGTGETRLTHGDPPGEQSPTWSPDGERIAFASINGLFAMEVDGGAWQRLTNGPADDANPAWSPVAPVIAFDGSRGLFDGDIYVVGARGGKLANVTESLELDSNPSWSSNGRKIAFLRRQNKHARARLHVMNADGRAQRNLQAIGDDFSRPSWSPDGTRLVYSWLTACRVPRLAGKSVREARRRIHEASCTVGGIRRSRSARPGGTVLLQRPRARSKRRIGWGIHLVVSSGR